MIVTSMQLTISSRRGIAVLQKESSALEGEEDVNDDSLYSADGRSLSGVSTAAHGARRTRRLRGAACGAATVSEEACGEKQNGPQQGEQGVK
jgi:hypothetical protein